MSHPQESPKVGMIVSLVSLITNLSLNYVLIFGKLGFPALGIRGAAIATLISRIVEFTFILIYVFLIDKKTTNPYRLAEKMGVRYPDEEQKKILREEGRLKAIIDEKYDGKLIKIKLTPNSTYLIQVV